MKREGLRTGRRIGKEGCWKAIRLRRIKKEDWKARRLRRIKKEDWKARRLSDPRRTGHWKIRAIRQSIDTGFTTDRRFMVIVSLIIRNYFQCIVTGLWLYAFLIEFILFFILFRNQIKHFLLIEFILFLKLYQIY